MPHISLNIYNNKSEEDIKLMVSRLRESLVGEPWGLKPTDISVSVAAYEPECFMPEVLKKIENDNLVIQSDYVR